MDTRLRYECLVYGYTRAIEKMHKLFMNIDEGIYGMIHDYYPKLLRFHLWNVTKFTVSEDKLEIKGRARDCNGYGVYAESPNDKGFNFGVHYWSLKNMLKIDNWTYDDNDSMGDGYCFHSIGVRSSRTASSVSEFENDGWWTKEECESQSYFKGESPFWGYQDIITAKLDCNEWTVTYYKDNIELKSDKIKPDLSYHFYAQFCANNRPYSHFKIVDTFDS